MFSIIKSPCFWGFFTQQNVFQTNNIFDENFAQLLEILAFCVLFSSNERQSFSGFSGTARSPYSVHIIVIGCGQIVVYHMTHP